VWPEVRLTEDLTNGSAAWSQMIVKRGLVLDRHVGRF